MSLAAVEEHCISLQRLGPEAKRPCLHPKQAFKSCKAQDSFNELSCTAAQAEEAYRHAHHICRLLHTLPQQLQPHSPPAPSTPAILVAESRPEVQSPFFPTPFHAPLAISAATARARSTKMASPIDLPRSCQNCLTESTPEWRTGPHGPQTLCNACGLRWRNERVPPRSIRKPTGPIVKQRPTKRRASAPRKGTTAYCA